MNAWLGRSALLALGALLGWLAKAQAGDGGESEWETDSDEGAGPAPRRRSAAGFASRAPAEELKMVLVVNAELKMGKGKIGAQCAHAAVGAVERLHEQRQAAALRHWERFGQPKICLQAGSTQELRALAAAAASKGLPTFVVQDAGRTQVAPGSRTVLAIGPAPKSAIDAVTGGLKLL